MELAHSTALQLLEYHAWATGKTLESVTPLSHEELLRDMRTSHSSVFGTLVHTYQADTVWLKRFRGESAKLGDAEPVTELADLKNTWMKIQSDFISLVHSWNDSDWTRMISYRFLSGEEARTPVYETLVHVVNHGTYHRGQVVTMLRQMGAEPISTDFIRYVRTR